MNGIFERLFSPNEFMPHGFCYLWRPELIWLHVISDGLTGLAYTTISFALLYFVRHRRGLPFTWMFVNFGVFIVACGSTHWMEIVTLWEPLYWLSGSLKAITAVASVSTAIMFVALIPKALRIPSPEELRRTNAALATSEARVRAVFNASLDALFVAQPVSNEHGAIVDFTIVEASTKGANLISPNIDLLSQDTQLFGHDPRLIEKYANVFQSGQALEDEFFFDSQDVGPRWFRHQAVPFSGGVAISIRNITARKKAEEARLLAAIVESSEDAIIACANDGTVESWNVGATRLLGYAAGEVLGKSRAFFAPRDHADELPGLLERIRRGEWIEGFHSALQKKDGTLVEVSLAVSPIRDPAGSIRGASLIARDITTVKDAERQLKASLREKEVLLKEVHHRVKNNLQMVTSLLNLQASHSQDTRAVSALRESQQRIRSIALFHEKIYQSRDIARIDMGAYLGELLSSVSAAVTDEHKIITTRVESEHVELPADTAIPCGLLANELIFNAFKHAFPKGPGCIDVSLRSVGEDGNLELGVSDDGVGLAEGFDPGNARTLGLQIVATLAEQIGGALAIHRNTPGTRFSVTFPVSK